MSSCARSQSCGEVSLSQLTQLPLQAPPKYKAFALDVGAGTSTLTVRALIVEEPVRAMRWLNMAWLKEGRT